MSDIDNNIDSISSQTPKVAMGVYLATVVSNLDPTYMGVLQVSLSRGVGGNNTAGQLVDVRYTTPSYGVTNEKHTTEVDDYNGTQKSYGMWMSPPELGTTGIVAFTNGDTKYGYWMGCVPDYNMNFMIPGNAATKFNIADTNTTAGKRIPVAEYNKKVNTGNYPDTTRINKPQHPLAKVLDSQGLIQDDIRGITSSSVRRESPTMVAGISTPGPADKQPGARRAPVGKQGAEVPNFPVSRLGGTTFVMDDGDAQFLRMTDAAEGPPKYESLEQLPKGTAPTGKVTIPHNELVRIRTRTGHQILMHNSEDLIYIGNAKGTTWIELTSNGKIDIYAEDSISIHTKNDFNFHADRDINMHAGRNVNVKADGKMQMETVGDYNLVIGKDGKITTTGNLDVSSKTNSLTASGNTNIKSGGTHAETAKKVYMNSAVAAVAAVKATPLPVYFNPAESPDAASIQSIMLRTPTHEPWPHHENLDPKSFAPAKTDALSSTAIDPPGMWKQYSLINDTFEKFLKPGSTQGEA